jgi:hypothetical protein
MPRRYGKSLPLRVVNLMKRGMRMLALFEMKLRSKALWKKALLGLLHQSETPQEPCTAPDPNEAQTGTTERGNTEEPETSQ